MAKLRTQAAEQPDDMTTLSVFAQLLEAAGQPAEALTLSNRWLFPRRPIRI